MKKIILSSLIIATMGITIIGCNKEEISSTKENEEIVSNENKVFEYSTPQEYDLQFAFKTHNQIMDNLLNGEYDDLSNIGFVNSVINTVETKSNTTFSLEEKEFIHNMNENFINVSTSDMVDLSIEKGYMSSQVGKTIMDIDGHMQTVEYNNYDDAKRDLEYLQSSFIDKNVDLTTSDKNLLTVLVKTMDNSAKHYENLYKLDERGKCGKCIRNNIGNILLADGVGSVQGLVGCLIFPPSCAVLIPALMAVGSGGAMIAKCHKQCF